MNKEEFKAAIQQGIPNTLPQTPNYDATLNHAPVRKKILTEEEEKLALRNALRYFPAEWHRELLAEFKLELEHYGRIYMDRLRPSYEINALPTYWYPAHQPKAAEIQAMTEKNI